MSGDTPLSRRAAVSLLAAGAGFLPALHLPLSSALGRATTPPQPNPPAANQPARPAPRPLRTVVLDPGHGGSDPGALGRGGRDEKTIVFGFARELQQRLGATGRYRVLLTRQGDHYVALRERVARARRAKADLFLSLHADWHPEASTRGASVYTLSDEASDRESAMLAQRENRVDAVNGVDMRRQSDQVAQALIAMTQRQTINASRKLAELVVECFEDSRIGLLPRAHRQAGFAVLTAAEIPAALIELGYLSNRQDEQLLLQRPHQQRLALSLARAVDQFFGVPQGAPAAKKT